jgi:hypothetical protein
LSCWGVCGSSLRLWSFCAVRPDVGDKGAVAAGSKGDDAFRSGAMLEQVFSWARHNR